MTTILMLMLLMFCLLAGIAMAVTLGLAAALVAALRCPWVRFAAVAGVVTIVVVKSLPSGDAPLRVTPAWAQEAALPELPLPIDLPVPTSTPKVGEDEEAPTSADEAAKFLLAGTYPSMESAQFGLARHFRPLIEACGDQITTQKPVLVFGPVPSRFLQEIVSRLREVGVQAPLKRGPSEDYINPADQVSLRVTLDDADPRLMNLERPLPLDRVKSLRFNLYVPGQPVIAQGVYIIDEPWVEDLAYWQAREHRKDRLYLVGFSEVLTATQAAAEESAIERLVAQLSMSSAASQSTTGMLALTEPLVLARAIRAYMDNIEELGFPRNYKWYIQWFDRPYGRVWRAVLLMDTSPEAMAQVEPFLRQSRQASTAAHEEAQRSHRVGWLSVSILIALLLVAYAFVNSTTQGYYVWPLRIGAVVLLLVLVALTVA